MFGFKHKERLACLADLHQVRYRIAIYFNLNLDDQPVSGIVLTARAVVKSSHLFLLRHEQREFAEAHVKWGASKFTIRLLDDNNVDSAGQGCRVDFVVKVVYRGEEVAQLADIFHCNRDKDEAEC